MNYRSLFLLDPTIHFFNHGSFGACPRPVFETYQAIQRELETQPVKFIGREFTTRLRSARQSLAEYLHCAVDDLVFFPNPTTAINMVARSLKLQPGDEILATDHEYGAMDRTWRFIATKVHARYINQPIAVPFGTEEEVIEQFWRGITPNTRVIFLSHITSQTALLFPIAGICERARAAGIVTIIDGAHAPGQIPLHLTQLGADIYVGACHKWLCAPKGSAFLYAAPHIQEQLEPLVVSWGYEAEAPGPSRFIDYHEYQGTDDPSAYLSVPAAVDFSQAHRWLARQQECRAEAASLWETFRTRYPIKPLAKHSSQFAQMFAVEIPSTDPQSFQTTLYERFQVEAPAYYWQDRAHLRISIQAYNDENDIAALFNALDTLWKS